jgi:hypothetical protein
MFPSFCRVSTKRLEKAGKSAVFFYMPGHKDLPGSEVTDVAFEEVDPVSNLTSC